jgi:hypothetical protein
MGQIPAHIQYRNYVPAEHGRSGASMTGLISLGMLMGLAAFAMAVVAGLVH